MRGNLCDSILTNSFTFKTISEEDVDRIISSMKTCKSAEIDKLSQAVGRTILNSLQNIFNLSLNTGIYPDSWKIARVTPIYKSDNKIVAVIDQFHYIKCSSNL